MDIFPGLDWNMIDSKREKNSLEAELRSRKAKLNNTGSNISTIR